MVPFLLVLLVVVPVVGGLLWRFAYELGRAARRGWEAEDRLLRDPELRSIDRDRREAGLRLPDGIE